MRKGTVAILMDQLPEFTSEDRHRWKRLASGLCEQIGLTEVESEAIRLCAERRHEGQVDAYLKEVISAALANDLDGLRSNMASGVVVPMWKGGVQ